MKTKNDDAQRRRNESSTNPLRNRELNNPVAHQTTPITRFSTSKRIVLMQQPGLHEKFAIVIPPHEEP